ncbi:unnamed protein product [Echinostoma caproni]|uniref:Cilia- and flagella-associated protein 91 n=1 Tax=Echinostoma caproni TaxID=27848 RepID=A0A183AUJ3_9TREM|nr:unnamed protein product [Echinostoma caproni]
MMHVEMAIQSLGQGRVISSDQISPRGPIAISRAVQTDYRDSEAQTDPYTPPYVVNVGETPEVLTLATLGYGRGLPAGLHDVEMIERARERRQIEMNLEPYSAIANDPKKVARRRKILQDMELREWHYREREVEAKLMRQRLAMKEASKTRDVIKDYANPSSQTFAPLTRLGVFPDRGSEANAVKNAYLNTYEGLLELESSLPHSSLNAKIKIKPIRMYTKDGFLRREFRNQQELAKLQQFLEGAFNPQQGPGRKPRFLEKIQRPPPRPITPSVAPPSEESMIERDLAAVVLQQLLRGRAIQTQMFEGKEKRKELIAELRSTHALLEDEIAEKKRQKRVIQSTQLKQSEIIHRENEMDNILGQIECASLADMLDFLSKELDRLIEERRIHALVLLAERHRRMREAEESGNRQREERRRREQDEIFKQIVKVHQESVESYLVSVAGVALDSTADSVAQHEMEEIARRVDARACDMEVNRDEIRSDLIAADLVHNFLIPEVCHFGQARLSCSISENNAVRNSLDDDDNVKFAEFLMIYFSGTTRLTSLKSW